ncbi:MAG: glycosyltransferase [Clostridium sp.]|nr:glycosyltransferase [Clostridium sp.]
MKISVALSTYNGESFIKEQLNSLINQTRLPDEVIISDDCSSDLTNEIVDEFIKENNLTNWIHYKNEINLGWKKNFVDTIAKATGDLIFTCDQDDVWYSRKLEHMEKIMTEKKNIQLLVSSFDYNMNDISEELDMNKLEKIEFNNRFMFVQFPGCVYCFRKPLFDNAFKWWYEYYPHDALLYRYAIINDGLYKINMPLIYYRRHENTATGREHKSTETKIESMEYYLKALDSISEHLANNDLENSEFKEKHVKKCTEWCNLRLKFLKSHRFILWLKLFRYIKYYYNFKSYLADLVMVLTKKGYNK